jgi:hypothetical protein
VELGEPLLEWDYSKRLLLLTKRTKELTMRLPLSANMKADGQVLWKMHFLVPKYLTETEN